MTNLFSYLPFDNLCFFSDKYIIILHRVTLNKIMTISFKIIMKREAIHSIVHSFIHSFIPMNLHVPQLFPQNMPQHLLAAYPSNTCRTSCQISLV